MLVLRVRANDHDAFRTLYERYSSAVLGVALSVIGDRSAAEDITHDVFLGFWRNPDGYEPARGVFAAWLLRVTRNRSIDVLRRRRDVTFSNVPAAADSDPIDPSYWIPDKDPSPEIQAVSRTTGEQIREALKGLSDDHRKLLEMAYFGGLTQREIAERVGKPLGTVKTQMRTSLMKLANVVSLQQLSTSNLVDRHVNDQRGEPGDWTVDQSLTSTNVGTEPS